MTSDMIYSIKFTQLRLRHLRFGDPLLSSNVDVICVYVPQGPLRQGHIPLDSRALESQDCEGSQGGQTAFNPVHALPHEIHPREAIQQNKNYLGYLSQHLDDSMGHLRFYYGPFLLRDAERPRSLETAFQLCDNLLWN